jgi:putative transposase
VSASRPSPARALRPAERDAVLARLHEERFQDRSPAAVYATLLDEGEYHCSIRTMYRLLDEHGEVRERRDQLTHPAYQKPELMATASNQLWSWDITKLLGPAKWTYFYLYVLLDVFSRHADSPIMPTINGNRVIGGARVVFGVGIIREFPRRPKAGRRGGIAPV